MPFSLSFKYNKIINRGGVIMLSDKLIYKVVTELFQDDQIVKNYENDFKSRLLVQKAIFMFQELNTEQRLQYPYNWYLAGPYSSSLTHTMYNNIIPFISEDENKESWDKMQFTKTGLEKIEKLKTFFSFDNKELKEYNLSMEDWYELLASCHYLYTRKNLLDKQDIAKELNKLKKRKFEIKQIDFVAEKYWRKMNG